MLIIVVVLSVRIVSLKIITKPKTNIEKTPMESMMEKLFLRHFYWLSL